jgi:hypothetical protein
MFVLKGHNVIIYSCAEYLSITLELMLCVIDISTLNKTYFIDLIWYYDKIIIFYVLFVCIFVFAWPTWPSWVFMQIVQTNIQHQIIDIKSPFQDVQPKIITNNIPCTEHTTKMTFLFFICINTHDGHVGQANTNIQTKQKIFFPFFSFFVNRYDIICILIAESYKKSIFSFFSPLL